MRGIVPARDEVVGFVEPIVTVFDQLAVDEDFRDAQIAAIRENDFRLVLLNSLADAMIN